MRKLAHIINPVKVPISSDLHKAQPITFNSIRIANEFVSTKLKIDLLSAQFPEDREIIPSFITKTPDLQRSVLDIKFFEQKRKLPILKDILDRLYNSTDAEFFIYSNVDIAPLPMFYLSIDKYIDSGIDSFVINRRTISNIYNPDQLWVMYADLGASHPGHDCFIFRRDAYPSFNLGMACIGAPFVGRILLWNMICNAKRFIELKNIHLTFHIGDEKVWKISANDEYKRYNMLQAQSVQQELINKFGPFNSAHSIYPYLLLSLENRKKYRFFYNSAKNKISTFFHKN